MDPVVVKVVEIVGAPHHFKLIEMGEHIGKRVERKREPEVRRAGELIGVVGIAEARAGAGPGTRAAPVVSQVEVGDLDEALDSYFMLFLHT